MTVESKKSSRGTVTLKRLRSTQIGAKTYDCFFEEVVGDDGQKRLTLVMKDERGKEVERQSINTKFMTDEYECYLENQMNEINDRKTILLFRNSKKQLMFKKEIPNDELHQVEDKFDKVEGIYDKKGSRCGSVYT